MMNVTTLNAQSSVVYKIVICISTVTQIGIHYYDAAFYFFFFYLQILVTFCNTFEYQNK